MLPLEMVQIDANRNHNNHQQSAYDPHMIHIRLFRLFRQRIHCRGRVVSCHLPRINIFKHRDYCSPKHHSEISEIIKLGVLCLRFCCRLGPRLAMLGPRLKSDLIYVNIDLSAFQSMAKGVITLVIIISVPIATIARTSWSPVTTHAEPRFQQRQLKGGI